MFYCLTFFNPKSYFGYLFLHILYIFVLVKSIKTDVKCVFKNLIIVVYCGPTIVVPIRLLGLD